MKALIIGTGAIGCALAIATIDGGMETAVLARNKTAEYLRVHGLKRTGIFGDITMMILALPGQQSCNIRTRFLSYSDRILETSGQDS